MSEQSPFQRAQQEGLNKQSSSLAGDKKRKRKRRRRKSKATTSRQNEQQKIKVDYAVARENAQLAGVIPTTPEGALRNERVNSFDPALPEMVRLALRDNWSVPDAAKAKIISELLVPFYTDDVVLDADGKQVKIRPSRKLLMELAKTLVALDQRYWERAHPTLAGQTKGGASPINVSIEANILAVKVLREALENERGGGQTALPPPVEPSLPGFSRFDGEVETGAVSTED